MLDKLFNLCNRYFARGFRADVAAKIAFPTVSIADNSGTKSVNIYRKRIILTDFVFRDMACADTCMVDAFHFLVPIVIVIVADTIHAIGLFIYFLIQLVWFCGITNTFALTAYLRGCNGYQPY